MASSKMSHTDLLIIGAGPSGMMAAAWASQYNIKTRIIDKNHARISKGQADGLQVRTLEIFDSFGVVDEVWNRGYRDSEMCTWLSNNDNGIYRSQRVLLQKVGISRYTSVAINQAVIEKTFLDLVAQRGLFHVERNMLPESLSLTESHPEDNDSYPINIKVRHLQNPRPLGVQNGTGQDTRSHLQIRADEDSDAAKEQGNGNAEAIESINAKYLLACDGAHSWTRRQLGLAMEGEQTDYVWGVIDIIPLTDFPDIRTACAIHSSTAGSILNIPREDRINRLYIQLGLEDNSNNRAHINPRKMIETARKIMAPYTIDYKYCDWWSLYKIGQRISPKFSVSNRIFLAGDAVHTHSPKLGQGMNVSMQDAYNIGWKLGAVLTGTAKPSILSTYETERRQVALELLNADREVARFYARNVNKTPPDPVPRDGIEPDTTTTPNFKLIRENLHSFLAGVGITYPPSILTASPTNSHTNSPSTTSPHAQNIPLGARLPSHKILNQASARPCHLASLLPSDTRFRILVFAGNILPPPQASRIENLSTTLYPLIQKYPPSILDIRTIHSSPRTAVSIFDFPPLFRPWHEDLGWDYETIFVDDTAAHDAECGFAYQRLGIDREEGCLVGVRPDQHVGWVGGLEDVEGLGRWLGGFLVERE